MWKSKYSLTRVHTHTKKKMTIPVLADCGRLASCLHALRWAEREFVWCAFAACWWHCGLYVCMYVCMYAHRICRMRSCTIVMCVFTNVCVYVYVYVSIHMCMYVCMHSYICMYVCMHIWMYFFLVCVCMHARHLVCIVVCIHMYMR
jgi:hypothetical protein